LARSHGGRRLGSRLGQIEEPGRGKDDAERLADGDIESIADREACFEEFCKSVDIRGTGRLTAESPRREAFEDDPRMVRAMVGMFGVAPGVPRGFAESFADPVTAK
jgi:hypothetical protein